MIEIDENELEDLRKKAKKYDEICDGVYAFYSDDNDDGEGGDLMDIGEWIATYFNWI